MLDTRILEGGQPFDWNAERLVLGGILGDRDAVYKVADRLTPSDFFTERHRRIYSAVLELLQRRHSGPREQIDPLTVQIELARRDELDKAGGVEYLRELINAAPTAVGIEREARTVHERALARRLADAGTQIAADAYDEPTDIALTLDRAEQRLFQLIEDSGTVQLQHIREALIQNYEHLTDRMERPFEVSGVPSGFPELDFYTEGFTPGDLVILAARPAVGKTSLALAIAHNAAKRGTASVIFSLEMDVKQLVTRFLGLTAMVGDILAVRAGYSRDPGAAAELMNLPILLDDTPGISVMELRTKARRIKSRDGLGLLVVDYLQLMRTDGKEENRVQEVATITRNLKSLARELDVPVIALSQLSRAAGDTGTEPRLSTLRESGAIEQDADVVIMLWKDKEDTPPGAPRLVHASVAKNRNGPTGAFKLLFEPERARFFSRKDDDMPV